MKQIVVNDIVKTYDSHTVLNNVTFTITKGKPICLMGKSGSGKTTLLNIILGLENADSGTITNIPCAAAVFQENRLCDSFSVKSNIKMVNSKISNYQISQHLNSVGLFDIENQKVSTLSGGMKRRVALVRAVVAQKDFLVLDEPFKGLDEKTLEMVYKYISKHSENIYCIVVSHNQDDAKKLNADIMTLEDGKISKK